MSALNVVCVRLFCNVYSHRPGAPYGDQRIGINHMKSFKKDQLCTVLRRIKWRRRQTTVQYIDYIAGKPLIEWINQLWVHFMLKSG